MEHPFFATTATRAEALRWLSIAEKLLSTRDLMGSKSFATRARDSDPTLSQADQILAIADTLLAGDIRIGNNQHDWYSILRLTPPQGRDSDLVANQYRSLALFLNPQQNKFPFADQAFRLVVDAWSVLGDPSRKSMYDRELAYYGQQQQQQQHQQQQHQQQHQPDPFNNPIQTMPQNFMFFGGSSAVSSIAQPQVHVGPSSSGGPSHFSQVQQVQAQQQPGGGSIREAQNFVSFDSGSHLAFGSASRSSSTHEHVNVNKTVQESFPAFGGGNVSVSASASTYGANREQVNNSNNNKQKQPQDNYTNPGDKTTNNVSVSDNDVGERRESEDISERMNVHEEEPVNEPANDNGASTFWTACPYCYYMYEYPIMYADCSLRCQNCRRAFQAVVIPSPPPVVNGQANFCCWGFLPMGFSMENWEKNKGAASAWTPFSPMFTCPQMGNMNNVKRTSAPRVYVDDDEVFVEFSDSSESDDDWHNGSGKRSKKRAKNVKGKGSSGTQNRSTRKVQVDKGKNVTAPNVIVNAQDGTEKPRDGIVNPQERVVSADRVEMPNKIMSEPTTLGSTTNKAVGEPTKQSTAGMSSNKPTGEPSKKGATASGRKQPGRVVKNFGKLDLNVECSNEVEEPAVRVHLGNGPVRGEDDNIEGIGFFEGLDEFLSSLPILNVVGDDKAVRTA